MTTTEPYILYGAPLSYFTGKVRGYLRWKGVPYREQLATPEIHATVLIPRVGYPIMPVVVTPDDECLQDSTEIIDWFEHHLPGPSIYPDGPRQHLAALLLEVYGDDWLLTPAMHYRWAYNRDWLLLQWGRMVAPLESPERQREIADEQSKMFQSFVPALGITDATIAGIETSYRAVLTDLDAHFAEHPFLFGTRPSIGDYGLLGPLFAHLYRDPESGKLMRTIAPSVSEWVERTEFGLEPRTGDFLLDDEIPETLLPVLSRMMAEQLPALADLTERLSAWADANPGADIPRSVGMQDVTLGGVPAQRMAMPFTQYRLQRAVDYYARLEGGDKTAVDALLDQIGGTRFRDLKIGKRVTRRNYQLAFA